MPCDENYECSSLRLLQHDVTAMKVTQDKQGSKIDQIWSMALTTLASIITVLLGLLGSYLLRR